MNSLTTQPISIDTVSSDVDIGDSVFGLSTAPFRVSKVVLQSPTAGDVVTFTNADGDTVVQVRSSGGEDVQQDFVEPVHSIGLVLDASQTVLSSGKVLVYV